VDPIWSDDTWAPENDRDDGPKTMTKSAHREWQQKVLGEPADGRTFPSALPVVIAMAALSIFFGVECLLRKGVPSKVGAVFFLFVGSYLVFVLIRGAIRTVRTGSAQKV
jgi:hypothetical protein